MVLDRLVVRYHDPTDDHDRQNLEALKDTSI
jgi:hypothetical protein